MGQKWMALNAFLLAAVMARNISGCATFTQFA